MVEPSALDSVPGTLERGQGTSNVACDRSSATRRTLIGPEIEDRAAVEPVNMDVIEGIMNSSY